MREDLENAYMEIIPVPGIEDRLEALQPNSHLAITCSPAKGVDETIESVSYTHLTLPTNREV